MYSEWKITNIEWVAYEDTTTALENRNLSFLDAPNHVMSDDELPNELFIGAKEDYIDWEIYEKTGRLPKSYKCCPDEDGKFENAFNSIWRSFDKVTELPYNTPYEEDKLY